jgi:hypothetical protein
VVVTDRLLGFRRHKSFLDRSVLFSLLEYHVLFKVVNVAMHIIFKTSFMVCRKSGYKSMIITRVHENLLNGSVAPPKLSGPIRGTKDCSANLTDRLEILGIVVASNDVHCYL